MLSITVDTLVDELDGSIVDGDISLRDAIAAAPSGETIDFDAALDGGTILLTLGQMAITDSLNIDASSVAGGLTIDASGNDPTPGVNRGDGSRIFNIDNDDFLTSIEVELRSLTLTGGDVADFGGAILSRENLSITGSTFSDNSSQSGGAIDATGLLTITRSTFTGNSASDNGGAIRTKGLTTIDSSTFSGNLAATRGGAINVHSGITITGSTISDNSSAEYGGGILGHKDSTVTIIDSLVSNNISVRYGGGLFTGGELTIVDSTISGNLAGRSGGGIRTIGTAVAAISGSTISGNSAEDDGGGILANGTATTITDSTISDNSAGDNGGGIFVSSGATEIIGSTISGNTAVDDGGGLLIRNGALSLDHTIVAGNFRGLATRNDLWGSFVATYSLIGDRTGAAITDNGGNLIGSSGAPIDPRLGLLADNGGLTQTHALLPGSPAIDAGDPTAVAGMGPVPSFDQRGSPFDRVMDIAGGGDRIDIGAYEVQAAPASLMVDTLVDELDLDFGPGDFSLREAIIFLASDTITFDGALDGGTIALDLALGELAITKVRTIDASSLTSGLTIDAGDGTDMTPGTGDGIRIFNIDDSDNGSLIDVEIVGLTLTGGDVTGDGGAVFSLENLSVTDSTISGNSADSDGGGIYARNGMTTITGSTISDNSAGDDGGGILASDTTAITASTISGNSADRDGGGLWTDGTTTITGSTISENSAGLNGGGILASDTTTIMASTITGNSADNNGGGFFIDDGVGSIAHSTIVGNVSDADQNGFGYGGGLFARSGTLSVDHAIVAQNTDHTSTGPDITGLFGAALNVQFSLIGDNTGSGLAAAPVGSPDGNGNLIGDPAGSGVINPLLGPLADSGGLTQTHALLPGSPAIDAGDGAIVSPPPSDQRGAPFVRIFGAAIDMGAYERQNLALVVDTLTDENDGDYSLGDLSLREAVDLANKHLDFADGVTFDSSLDGGTILLTLGELAINDSLTIDANSLASGLTIDAGGNSRIFNVDDGNPLTSIDVELRGLTLTGGAVGGSGGAILSQENLSITGSSISGNSAGDGGGIWANGTTAITGSTISENSASDYGGGIYAVFGATTITGSTISNNTAGDGGGIWTYGTTTTLTDSTISGNSANLGGGVLTFSGTTTVTDSTVSANSASSGGGLWSFSGTTAVTGSTVSGNLASSDGGGIYAQYGTTTITNGTISGNSAGEEGGGVWAGDTTTIIGSTISGNSAGDEGGGILISAATTIAHSTITENTGATGGGLFLREGTTNLDHTIVANNVSLSGFGPDLTGLFGASLNPTYNVIGDNSNSGLAEAPIGSPDANGNFIGSSTGAGIINPLLGPLADNGGPTETHALLFGSPALDAGDPNFMSPPDYDQRGAPFGRISGSAIDIGAYEAQSPPLLGVLNGDLNGDGLVDGADAGIMFANWGASDVLYADGDVNGDNIIDGADVGILFAKWTGDSAVATATFTASLDAPTHNVSARSEVAPLVATASTTSTFGRPTSDILFRASGPGLASFFNSARSERPNERPKAIREVERLELALENAWEGFEPLATEREDLTSGLIELGSDGHLKRHAQATDDLFASLAEEDGLAVLRSSW